MLDVRSDLKNIIFSVCKIGLDVLPLEERTNIGIETFKAILFQVQMTNQNFIKKQSTT